MPYLMIDLDDVADCRRGIQQLRQIVGGRGDERGGGQEPKGPGGRRRGERHGRGACGEDVGKAVGEKNRTPLRDRFRPLKQRGVWRFLSGIAALDDTPRSLAELDDVLGLKKNKMRSMKAIFAKLENRLDVRFLVPAEEAGQDDAGNARYRMPPRVRKAVQKLTD